MIVTAPQAIAISIRHLPVIVSPGILDMQGSVRLVAPTAFEEGLAMRA